MTSPRSYDGVGYPSPSFSSGTPIYDSLVAERGVPQIAPINVPAALPPALSTGYGSGLSGPSYENNRYGTGYDSPGSNLPALPPARLALGPGPSSAPSSGPATAYIPAQPAPAYAAAPQPPVPGYGGPQPYLPGQRPQTPAPGFTQAATGGYQPSGGQSFGGQNTFVGGHGGPQTFGAQPVGGPPGPQAMAGQPQGPQSFGGQPGFSGQGAQPGGFGGSGEQSFGGAQLRPAVTPVAPVRPMQPQRPGPYGEPGQFQQGGYQPQAQNY
ncbi:DUF6643 family protein [Kitasatospora sp. NPDC058032]|uniref:DUF6643 family protein n=1 Tax=Kitasatospora sp. NPDC058032 TaxID=3346307 RepID=UPI0036DA5DF0